MQPMKPWEKVMCDILERYHWYIIWGMGGKFKTSMFRVISLLESKYVDVCLWVYMCMRESRNEIVAN